MNTQNAILHFSVWTHTGVILSISTFVEVMGCRLFRFNPFICEINDDVSSMRFKAQITMTF